MPLKLFKIRILPSSLPASFFKSDFNCSKSETHLFSSELFISSANVLALFMSDCISFESQSFSTLGCKLISTGTSSVWSITGKNTEQTGLAPF